MRSRTIALLLVCLSSALFFGGASTATAQSGYGGADSSVLPATAERGETVEVRSTGWLAGGDVTITLYSEPVRLGVFTTDNTGRLAATITIPSDIPIGRHTVELAGLRADSSPRVLSQPIQIVDPTTSGGSNDDGVSGGGSDDSGSGGSSDGVPGELLSRTGPRATVQLLQAGAVFLAAGAFALLIGRRAAARSSNRVVATRARRSPRRSRSAPLVGSDRI